MPEDSSRRDSEPDRPTRWDVARVLTATSRVASASSDVDEAFQWALDVVCASIRWPLGHVCRVDGNRLVSSDIWHNDDPERYRPFVEATRRLRFDRSVTLPAQIAVNRRSEWWEDLREQSGLARAAAIEDVGLRSAFGFPIISSAGVEGVLEFFAPFPAPADEELLGLLSHVGVQLGHMVDRARADGALRSSAQRLAEAERIGRAGSWSWTVGTEELTCSDELREIFGFAPDFFLTPNKFVARVHFEDRGRVLEALSRTVETGESMDYDFRILRDDGTVRWIYSRIAPVEIKDGAVVRITGYSQDVTERRSAEDARRLAQLELESHQRILKGIASDAPVRETLEAICLDVEARYDGAKCTVLLADHDQRVLLHAAAPTLPPSFCRAIDRLPIEEGTSACGTSVAINQTIIVEDALADPLTKDFVGLAEQYGFRAVWSQPLTNRDGLVIGAFAVYRSVPYRPDEDEMLSILTAGSLAALAIERSQTYQALSDAATFDSLTGLATRAAFLDQVEARLDHRGSPTGVMFLDLDGFKWINDSLGHPAGDRILQEVARRLRDRLDGAHLVARFGGDEFTVLLRDTLPPTLEEALRAVQESFDDPFDLDGGEFFLTCCTGVALGDSSSDAFGLIRDADTAMFAAKERGRSQQVSFDASLRERAVARVRLESDMRRGIERDEFVMYYQPVVQIATGEWAAVESLVRWQHPTHGLVPPSDFIPMAEESGLIVPLGQHILEKVISERASWEVPDLRVGVNMSVVQLADHSVSHLISGLLDHYGLAPPQLILEVTETAVMQRVETARATLDDLTRHGAHIVIDDFGTGYSSIARLGDLPVSGVKIDMRFTRTLGRDPKAARVVGAMTDLAHAHGLYVVVEGIETPEALDTAAGLGCEFAQGYHLARPAPAAQLLELRASTRAPTD